MQANTERDNSVKVAVRIRPLNDEELSQDSGLFISTAGLNQINAGPDTYFTFDYVFGPNAKQINIYDDCVEDLVSATFEGFNSTILAYGQTGSGKTWTMGSSSPDLKGSQDTMGIIPRVIKRLFEVIREREAEDCNSSYKVYVQFLEIYGEDMRDLLDTTRTSKVSIRESPEGEVFVSGAREELVSSYEQMMQALDEGSTHRITASTKMNQTSSRSHAIFTVFMEHTIRTSTALIQSTDGSLDSPSEDSGGFFRGEDATAVSSEIAEIKKVPFAANQEVRRCKFRFVDLAGSERAKRTGAQGVQLKEGIDINKGLLALGNVISALGDDSKKGKVFVPYRDSKLTRILQDSLGGNSKTLMICCVSPAYVNFGESVNALRYANRARNIKNKPVVNRDPALVVIDELKGLLKAVCSELLEMRLKRQFVDVTAPVPLKILEGCAYAATPASSTALSQAAASLETSTRGDRGISSATSGNRKTPEPAALRKLQEELLFANKKLSESDFELQRATAQLKLARQTVSETSDALLFARSERDFYRMKWEEVCPLEAGELDNPSESGKEAAAEKEQAIEKFSQYLKEIDSLKRQLAEEKNRAAAAGPSDCTALLGNSGVVGKDFAVDEEFTSSIAALISHTREQLREEAQRLRGFESGPPGGNEEDSEDDAGRGKTHSAGGADDSSFADDQASGLTASADLEEEKAFVKRQKMLSSEVTELGESIQLKEQLVAQLMRSQHQYETMKTFYEQKLAALGNEMSEKQSARDQVESELQRLAAEQTEQHSAILKPDLERRLREDLRLKDEELKQLKRKQEELRQLSQSQSRHMQQQAKLEADIVAMKKQRVELTRTLQSEKRAHLADLSAKAREIERLKRELHKNASEIKKLGRDKELAEVKAREAMREGVILKKKTQELIRGGADSLAHTRAAVRSINKVSRVNGQIGGKRVLTEDELRTKRWLDKRITEISAREALTDQLKKLFEAQLELLGRKELLEEERRLLSAQAPSDSSLSEGEVGESPESARVMERLSETTEQLAEVNALVAQKSAMIEDLQRQVEGSSEVPGIEKSLEVLKKSAAGSLPASHELIRLLFDMLVSASKTAQHKTKVLEEQRLRERRLLQEVEERAAALESERRGRDMDVTRVASEYEQNMASLFSNMASLTPALASSSAPAAQMGGGFSSPPMSPFKDSGTAALDPTKLQLAISTEESKFLRSQLQRQALKSSQMQSKLLETDKLREKLLKELDAKNAQIRFLEEERGLFKELADDLRHGLATLGKQGKVVAESVRDEAARRRKSSVGLFSEYMNLSGTGAAGLLGDLDERDDDDRSDSESILGEFECLADEIFRTGGIQPSSSAVSTIGGDGSGKARPLSGNASDPSKAVVYDRLTNPNYFTGHMKAVFTKDIEEKRRRIKVSRNQERSTSTTFQLGTHRREALQINTNPNALPPVPPVNTSSSTNSTGASTTKNEALSKRAASVSADAHHYKFFNDSVGDQAPGTSMDSDGSVQLSAPSTFSTEEPSRQTAATSQEPRNVFSRLASKFTGIHKHRNSVDDAVLSPTAAAAAAGIREGSPSNGAHHDATTGAASSVRAGVVGDSPGGKSPMNTTTTSPAKVRVQPSPAAVGPASELEVVVAEETMGDAAC